eukprot:6174785-Pleurochrysis_carterae.AAC.2
MTIGCEGVPRATISTVPPSSCSRSASARTNTSPSASASSAAFALGAHARVLGGALGLPAIELQVRLHRRHLRRLEEPVPKPLLVHREEQALALAQCAHDRPVERQIDPRQQIGADEGVEAAEQLAPAV